MNFNLEKIYFDSSTYIWKCKGNMSGDKEELLNESISIMESKKERSKFDAYGYLDSLKNDINFMGNLVIKNKLDAVCQFGIDVCKNIWDSEEGKKHNKVNADAWVNMVRSVDPHQIQFKHEEMKGVDKFHTHTDLNKLNNEFYPHYTYVYYIQMPDIMEDEDGVLYFRGNNNKEYWIRPEEDDLIVMPGWMPHAPNNAPKSNLDRIVLAGNVGFEMIKKEKSLM